MTKAEIVILAAHQQPMRASRLVSAESVGDVFTTYLLTDSEAPVYAADPTWHVTEYLVSMN